MRNETNQSKFEHISHGSKIEIWNPNASPTTVDEKESLERKKAQLAALYRNHDETKDYTNEDPLDKFKDSTARVRLCITAKGPDGKSMVAACTVGLMADFSTAPENQRHGVIQIEGAVTDKNYRGQGVMRSIFQTILKNIPGQLIEEVRLAPTDEEDVDPNIVAKHLQQPIFTIETYFVQHTSPDADKYAGSAAMAGVFAQEALRTGLRLDSAASKKMTGDFHQLDLNLRENEIQVVCNESLHFAETEILDSQKKLVAVAPSRVIIENESVIPTTEPEATLYDITYKAVNRGVVFNVEDEFGASVWGSTALRDVQKLLDIVDTFPSTKSPTRPLSIRYVASK